MATQALNAEKSVPSFSEAMSFGASGNSSAVVIAVG
jgi:hypothetical protein